MKLKRIFVVLAAVAVMVATAAVPAMAQNADKAEKQAQKAATAGGASSNVAPARGGTQKALPSSGSMPAGDIALLGVGALLVGGGILLYKRSTVS